MKVSGVSVQVSAQKKIKYQTKHNDQNSKFQAIGF